MDITWTQDLIFVDYKYTIYITIVFTVFNAVICHIVIKLNIYIVMYLTRLTGQIHSSFMTCI